MKNFILLFGLSLFLAGCKDTPKPPGPLPLPPVTPPIPIAPARPVPPCGLDATETVQQAIQDPTLIGGTPADIANWPSSVYARAGSSACSSTLIGDRVLLSAGHCMSNGGTVSFTAGANQYKARCTHHPKYKGNSTADWALCLVERPVTGVVFERLATKMILRIGDKVRLTGYGCTSPGGGSGGNDGIFRIGKADVTSLPSGENFDVVTLGGAALCFGDSGGAAYFEFSDGTREIFGVNSRGNIKNTSYLPAVGSPVAQAFFEDWATKNGVKICGIHSDAVSCRDEKPITPPPPPPPPAPKFDFEIAAPAGCIRGKLNPGFESKKDAIVEGLKNTLNGF